jgi:transcriptional regulator of heat shock response
MEGEMTQNEEMLNMLRGSYDTGKPDEVKNVLIDQMKALIALSNEIDERSKELKEKNRQYDLLELEVFESMFEQDIQSIKVEDKLLFRKINEYPQIVEKVAFFEWLRSNGFQSLIKEDVNARTLASFWKDYSDGKSDEELEEVKPMLKIFEKKSIGMRRG